MKTLISTSALGNLIRREKNNSGSDFTVKSKKSGKEYTVKISRSKWNEKWYTHVRIEKGYLNFTYLGSYFKGKLYSKGHVVTTPASVAIGFILDKAENRKFDWLDSKIELMHTGNCIICGKTLTDSHSIELGMGPICSKS